MRFLDCFIELLRRVSWFEGRQRLAIPVSTARFSHLVGEHSMMAFRRPLLTLLTFLSVTNAGHQCSNDYCADELRDCTTYCLGGWRYSCFGGRYPVTTGTNIIGCTLFTCCLPHPPPSPPPPPRPPPPNPPPPQYSVSRSLPRHVS